MTFYCKYSNTYIAQEQKKSHFLADHHMVIKIKKLEYAVINTQCMFKYLQLSW